MTEPIDLLAIASDRLHAAMNGLAMTHAMQNSPAASRAHAVATLEYQLASADLDAVQALGRDLARAGMHIVRDEP